MRAAGLFDDGWYRTAYPDIAEDEDPLWHFATRGAAAGRDPNPLFDTTWYLTTYDDVRRSGVNPLVHYLEFGADEGRDPGPRFATRWYVGANPDVRGPRRTRSATT